MSGNQPEKGLMQPDPGKRTRSVPATRATPEELTGVAPQPMSIENHGTPHWSSGAQPMSAEAFLLQWATNHVFPYQDYNKRWYGEGMVAFAEAYAAHRHDSLIAERDAERVKAAQECVKLIKRAEAAEKDTAILLERVRGLTEALEAAEHERDAARRISLDNLLQDNEEIERLRRLQGGEWVSVKERLPVMDGKKYQTWNAGYPGVERNGWDSNTAQRQSSWYSFHKFGFGITHWRELPAPPTAEPKYPCPMCGAEGIEVCSGCGTKTSERDCGCPCGTHYICSRNCGADPVKEGK